MRLVAVAVFGVSLAGNALLMKALRAPDGESADDDPAPTTTTRATQDLAAAPRPSGKGTCDQRIATAEQHLAREEEALRAYLPAEQLFGRGLPHPAAERGLHPVLGRLFEAEAGRRRYSLECKDVACKLVLNDPADAGEEAWDQAVNGDAEMREWTHEGRLARAVPVPDVAGQARIERTIYFKLNGPRALAMAGER